MPSAAATCARVDEPRHVGHRRRVSPITGPGDAEARRVDRAARRARASPSSQERGDHRRQIGDSRACRTSGRASGRGRAGAASNSPSSVLVPPMSPARIMCRLTSPLILHHLGAVSSPQPCSRRGRLPSPSPESSRVSRSRDSSSSSPESSARSAARTRARSSRVSAASRPTTSTRRRRCWSSARKGSGRRRRRRRTDGEPTAREDEQAETRRGAERAAGRRADSDPDRRGVLPARRRADARHAEAAVPRAARPAGALPRAARGSPALPREVRRPPAGAADQRRHVLRVSRSRRSSSRPTKSSSQGAHVPQRRARADRGAAGAARVRLPARCGAGEDHHAAAARAARSRRRRRRRSTAPRRCATPRSPRSTSARRPRSTMATTRRRRRRRRRTGRRSSSIRISCAALINLANIHYSRDELAEAQALYERAIGLESDFFEAHFNLGNIYHDLGRFRRGAGLLPRGAAAQPVLRRRALLPGGHVREDGAVAGRAPALARRTSSSRRRASGSSWRGSSRSRAVASPASGRDLSSGSRPGSRFFGVRRSL